MMLIYMIVFQITVIKADMYLQLGHNFPVHTAVFDLTVKILTPLI